MISFVINDMTCGHCVASVTKAVHAVDSAAQVQASLADHRVDISAAPATSEQLRVAIQAAGFTPVPAHAA
jgi:copper chaperone